MDEAHLKETDEHKEGDLPIGTVESHEPNESATENQYPAAPASTAKPASPVEPDNNAADAPAYGTSETNRAAEDTYETESENTAEKDAYMPADDAEPSQKQTDGSQREKSGIKIDLSAIEGDEVIPDKGTAHSFGRKVNIAFCAAAFIVLFIYLFIAGEGEDTVHAFTTFNWGFMLIALVGIVVYWVLESLSMQLICDKLYAGFSFVKTNIVTVIGQYFNCITPLSSGGQPMQAYYYSRFGLPVKHTMPMLLCRFIVYQLTMTVYAIIVLLLRFNYFTQDLKPIMYLVAIGFIGGFVLIAALFALAFAKNTVMKFATWGIKLLGKIGILKDADEKLKKATQSLEEGYLGIRYLLKEPKLLLQVSGVTFVQLTVYFSLSWIIFAGFGLENNDYLTVLSCQAFVYLIASFVPLPGAVGAVESSYIVFFNYVYGDTSIVALSTFIWRFLTFYLPIVLGMLLTIFVNKENSFLARWIRRDDARMAFADHTVKPREKKRRFGKHARQAVPDETAATQMPHPIAASPNTFTTHANGARFETTQPSTNPSRINEPKQTPMPFQAAETKPMTAVPIDTGTVAAASAATESLGTTAKSD